MANTAVKANEMNVYFSGSTIGSAIDFEFSVEGETIDITTLSSNGWKEFLQGDKSWTLSTSGLVTRFSATSDYGILLNHLKEEEIPVLVTIRTSNNGDTYEEGKAIITNVSMSGSEGDKIEYSVDFQGTGKPTTETVS